MKDNTQPLHKGPVVIETTLKMPTETPCTGLLERKGDNAWIRSAQNLYKPSKNDPFVPLKFIQKWNLKTGDLIQGSSGLNNNKPRLFSITSINKHSTSTDLLRPSFEDLTPIFPVQQLNLEFKDGSQEDVSRKTVDLLAPQGLGQRSLIVSPPKAGKTMLLTHIAQGIEHNHPDIELIVVLIDERPEEVTEMQKQLKSLVWASTFDEQPSSHIRIAELAIERAKRLVEQGSDVVVLIDSVTRLARAYNQVFPSSGKTLSGGVDANVLHYPKKLFGAARNTEEAGSLTVIGTALIDTGSVMDQVIFEEFKGTGNSEIYLDRKLTERRLFPAIHINKSGTRRDEKIIPEDILIKTNMLRKMLHSMDDIEANKFLAERLKDNKSLTDFFRSMANK